MNIKNYGLIALVIIALIIIYDAATRKPLGSSLGSIGSGVGGFGYGLGYGVESFGSGVGGGVGALISRSTSVQVRPAFVPTLGLNIELPSWLVPK